MSNLRNSPVTLSNLGAKSNKVTFDEHFRHIGNVILY